MELHVWSDIACPWCWIGKKQLEIALADFEPEVRVLWHAFELNPEAPIASLEPADYAQRLSDKYRMSRLDAEAFVERMTQAGRDVGVDMRFDRIRPCNTFGAHRLMAWARTLGDHGTLKERLFTAYLSEGQDLNDADVLCRLAAEVELDGKEAAAVLSDGLFADQVRRDQSEAQVLGITGVPFFVFGRGLAASGAQPPEVLRGALARVHSLEAAESSAGDSSASACCSSGGCCC
ncbi:MAG: DsbA family oxidoreductase [Acidobacteriota bacterium]